MIIDGRKIAKEIIENLQGKGLSLGVVQAGDNPASLSFIKEKRKMAKEVGINFNLYSFKKDISPSQLKKEIKKISDQGVVIQLPLPPNFPEQEILDCVPFKKDIDVLSSLSFHKFYNKELDILPPVVSALSKIIEKFNIDIEGKKTAVVGAGKLIGRPIALFLLLKGAQVSVFTKERRDSLDLSDYDLVVSGTGVPELIEEIKEGATIIDFGFGIKEGKITGDFKKEKVIEKAKLFTPVPGGVGPISVACLLENLIKRYGT